MSQEPNHRLCRDKSPADPEFQKNVSDVDAAVAALIRKSDGLGPLGVGSHFIGQPGVDQLQPGDKQSNPKQAMGDTKLPLHLVPTTAIAAEAMAFLEGKLKYGRSNWREAGVLASTYYAAARRHLDDWFEGEDVAPDSLVAHLAHARACLGILIDAAEHNMMIDDRAYAPVPGYANLRERLAPQVTAMTAKYADRHPKHYDRRDMATE